MPKPLAIDSHGRATLPAPFVGACAGGQAAVASTSRHHLLLAPPKSAGELVLAGSLGDLVVADLLSFLNMFRKGGVLHFSLRGGSKELYLIQGEIVNAVSDFPDEDLGEHLYTLGRLDRDTVQRVRALCNGRSEDFGKVLVERGVIAPADLWVALRGQIEMIVYNLFTVHEGEFAYLARDVEASGLPQFSMSTQNLIMEGLRRVDERGLFMRRIKSLDVRPEVTGLEVAGLTTVEQRLLTTVRGGCRDVRDALRRSGLGEFDGLRLLYQLSEKGAVRFSLPAAPVADGALSEILAIYNGALTALYRAISAHNPAFDQELRLYLRDMPQPFSFVFQEVAARTDGSLDGNRIIANLAGLEEGDKQKLLADALGELLFMECIAARRELGAAASAELVQRVQEIARRVKNLVGRNDA